MKNIYLMFGEEKYLLREKVKNWKSQFITKYGDFGLEEFKEKKIHFSLIKESIQNTGIFAEKKMIILHNFLKNNNPETQEEFIELLETLNEEILLILIEEQKPDKRKRAFKSIQKIGNIEEFKKLRTSAIIKFIELELEKNGSSISKEDAEYLAYITANSLSFLSKELEKLILLKPNQIINKEDINSIVSPHFNTNVFKLTDILGSKNKSEVLNKLYEVTESESEVMMIFYMLIRHFRLLVQTRLLLDKNISSKEIASKLKIAPFLVFNLIKQAKSFDHQTLFNKYNKLLKIEIGLKSSLIKISAGNNKDLIQNLAFAII